MWIHFYNLLERLQFIITMYSKFCIEYHNHDFRFVVQACRLVQQTGKSPYYLD
jgi:hypothetical protein